jgi:translation elongation factor EF-1beta
MFLNNKYIQFLKLINFSIDYKVKLFYFYVMTDKEISKFGEIQYLKGRLDELFKALPTVVDVSRSRKLDQRVEKYLIKLRTVDEIAFHLYQVELKTRHKSKERSKKEIKELLEEVLSVENISQELLDKIKKQIDTY